MKLTLIIDRERCYKSGECYYNHPDLLHMGADGFPEVKMTVIASDRARLEAQQAVEVCPSQAIALVGDD